MNRFKWFLIVALIFIGKNNVFASEEIYFTTSSGHEVYFQHYIDEGKLGFILIDDNGLSPEYVIDEFVKTAVAGEHYSYIDIGAPCDGCQVEYRPKEEMHSLKLATQNSSSSQSRTKIKNTVVEQFVVIPLQEGWQAVKNWLTSPDENPDVAQHGIIFMNTDEQGRPVSICKMVASYTCEHTSDLQLVQLANGFTIEVEVPEIDSSTWEEEMMIFFAVQKAVRDYGMPKKYLCKTVYTGPKGDVTAQIICYFTE